MLKHRKIWSVVFFVLLCTVFISYSGYTNTAEAKSKTYCIEATPKISEKVYEYLDEIYIEKYPELGLEFPFGSDGDKKVLKAAADKITANAKTDKAKVEKIIRWAEINIDYYSYTSGEGYIYAIDTYYAKKGNCIGFSQLILNLCRLSGIKAVMCCGTRGDMENVLTLEDREPDHAWLMIHLDGKWYLYDPLFDVYGSGDKKFIDKWYFFDFIEGVSPYVKKYAKYMWSGYCIFYIDGKFMHYANGKPASEYYGNSSSPGSSVNGCMPFYANARYYVDGISDGFEYRDNPERKNSMRNDECYTNGWILYGNALYYAKPNGINTGARIMNYGSQCLYFSFMSDAVILPGKAEDYTCTDGYLTMYEGDKLKISYTWKEDAAEMGRVAVYESVDPSIAKIDKNGVITAVSEGLATFSVHTIDPTVEESGYWNGTLYQVYVLPKKRTAKYSFCGADHKYKTTITAATLSKNGKEENQCTVCGYVASKSTTIYYPKTIKLSKTEYTYNGKVQTPSVTVKDSKGNTLKKDTDYTIKYESGRKLPGKYTVTITFKGNYSGTKKLTYTIAPRVTTKITASQTITTITLKWNKVTGADGYRIYKYNSKTKKYEHIASVTKGTSYKVSKLKSGTAYKFKVRAYTKDDGTIWGSYSDVFATATKTKTPAISSIYSNTKGKAVVRWNNVSGESGYQVYYASSKNGTYKKVASYAENKTAGSKTKLASGKKYYFKVRAYKKTASGTVYSAWSTVKSIKIK